MVIKPLNKIKLVHLYYLLQTVRFDRLIEKSSVSQITREKMKLVRVPIISDVKILEILRTLDYKIELSEKNVKFLNKLKSELLNLLFI